MVSNFFFQGLGENTVHYILHWKAMHAVFKDSRNRLLKFFLFLSALFVIFAVNWNYINIVLVSVPTVIKRHKMYMKLTDNGEW